MADEAKAKLSDMILGQDVQLFYGGKARDRYDRALAQMYTSQSETWVQEEMIRAGFGRVYTWPDTWQDSDRLYAAERDAREAGRGIWGHPFFCLVKSAGHQAGQFTK